MSSYDSEHQRRRALNRHSKPVDPAKQASWLRAAAAGMVRKADALEALVASATTTISEEETTNG